MGLEVLVEILVVPTTGFCCPLERSRRVVEGVQGAAGCRLHGDHGSQSWAGEDAELRMEAVAPGVSQRHLGRGVAALGASSAAEDECAASLLLEAQEHSCQCGSHIAFLHGCPSRR